MSVKFHFLNVGDGDCTIVDFPDRVVTSTNAQQDARIMVVDMHHHEDHDDYEHVIDYYKSNFTNSFGLRPVFRYVSTHPHKDHLKGLEKFFSEIPVINFWDIEHNFQPEKSGFDWEEYKDDWEFYEKIRKSETDPKVLKHMDTDSPRPYWDEDRIEVLSPSSELFASVHTKEDGTRCTTEEIGARLNNLSYVLLIRVNGLKILLAADAEVPAWNYIMEKHKNKIKDIDILKAPHHGRESAFYEEAVKWMNPQYIVFSSSEDCEHTVPEKYQKAAPRSVILKTCDLGSFILDCDFNGNITLK